MENVLDIFTDRISDPHDPMRSDIDRGGLFDLAENIKANGLINPITVRPVGDMYEVVAGHRRLAACRIAGIIKIACVVRELDEQQTFAVMAAENLERQDVNPVDEAIFIRRFLERTGKSVEDVAKALRRSLAWVTSRLAIGEMPDYMQQYLKEGTLKIGTALALVQITDDRIRHVWVDMAVRDGASVAQAEYWLHSWKMTQVPGGASLEQPPGGFEAAAAGPVMFRCALDGKEYDARTVHSVFIADANWAIFQALTNEYRKQETVAPPPTAAALPQE